MKYTAHAFHEFHSHLCIQPLMVELEPNFKSTRASMAKMAEIIKSMSAPVFMIVFGRLGRIALDLVALLQAELPSPFHHRLWYRRTWKAAERMTGCSKG